MPLSSPPWRQAAQTHASPAFPSTFHSPSSILISQEQHKVDGGAHAHLSDRHLSSTIQAVKGWSCARTSSCGKAGVLSPEICGERRVDPLRPGQRVPSASTALPQKPDLQADPDAGHLAGTGKRPSGGQKQPPSRPSKSPKMEQ